MWPYTGKKTAQSNLHVHGSTPLPTRPKKGGLDKEYYKKMAHPRAGQFSFSLNQIADDGRVIQCYGLNNSDITEQFGSNVDRNKLQINMMKPSKQLHEKNVNRLKVVLSMPANERRMSLSHVTGAIMRNEIVPSDMRLQNEAFLSDYMRSTTTTPKLPPLRRKSLKLAQDIEGKVRARPLKHRAPLVKYHDEHPEEEEGDTILPAITVDAGKTNTEWLANPSADGSAKGFRLRGGMSGRRRSSVGHGFGRRRSDDVDTNSPQLGQMGRKDSVAQTTESISEQFRAAMQAGAADQAGNFNIAGTRDVLTKQLSAKPDMSKTNNYKLRHEYGKNLEKNWFKNYMMKQSKPKTKPADTNQDCELRLDIFYSPEPESDSDIADNEDDGFLEDASLHCGGYSTATAEGRGRSKPSRRISDLPANAIMEEDEPTESNFDSSGSDIEIVMKENQLIQRRTKHKMRKKRNRQIQRYKTFMDKEPAAPKPSDKVEEVPLTDQEIRALRLNLRNKERLKKLKGKRKFLQVANAVYIVAQFKKILTNIRKRKRNVIKKRQQKIAAMVAKRVMMKDIKTIEEEAGETDEDEREPTPKPTLGDQFMREIGNKLVYDLEKLNIQTDYDTGEEESDSEQESEKPKTNEKPANGIANKNPSRFAAECKKVSIEDARFSHQKRFIPNRLFKRRNTLPNIERPLEFIVEVPCKPKRKGKGKKDGFGKFARRPPTPEMKCSCYFHNKLLARKSQASLAAGTPIKCQQHQPDVKKQKMKKVKVQTSGLFRTYSVDNLSKRRPIELRDLLEGIDIPAKEIKLQILARKFRRQRRRRQRVTLSPCRLPEASQDDVRQESDSGSEEAESDDSDKSDYDFVYGAPFVGCGVMWHKDSASNRRQTWSEEDVEREVKKITRVFHELKECRYLRMDGFNTAIMAKLNEKKLLI